MNESKRLGAAARGLATSLASWVVLGVAGGACAGLADAAFSALRLWDQLGGFGRIELLALGASLGAGAGVLLAVGCWAAVALGQALGPWCIRRWAAIWPATLAAPVLWYDAFALFGGPQAQKVPHHRFISLALFVVGIVAFGALGWMVSVVLKGLPRRRFVLGASASGVFLLVSFANGRVLPHLYPWFHQSLAVFSLAASLCAVQLFMVARPALRGSLVTIAVMAMPLAMSHYALTTSRQVRFALFDKTAALSTYARLLPLPQPRRLPAVAPLTSAGQSIAPLPEGPKRPGSDVILITVDALRPDHVGAYGYPRSTTPNLDALAAESTRFERAYTQAPHTSFATTSMLTGKYYPTLLRLRSGEGGEPITTVLQRYGWRTAAFYPPAVFFVDGDKLATFRDTAFGFEYAKIEFMAAEPRIEQIKEYFDTIKPERAFLWVHFFEPHEPYEAHDGHNFGPPGKGTDRDRYDSEIAYTDKAVGRLLRYFKITRPRAIVIVSADHGEEFDEHGGRYHGSSLYEEQVRVPLLVYVPGVTPHVVGGQVQLVDLAPTILGLLDIPLPARMKGTDLGPWLAAAGAPSARLPPAFAEVEDKRMIVTDGAKLICARDGALCQLFDLVADPGERHDLIDMQPQRAASLHAGMEKWLDEQGRLEVLTPVKASGGLPKAVQQGRLGEAEAAPALLNLVVGGAPSPFSQEAARLLALLPPQPALAAKLNEAVVNVAAHGGQASQWLSIAAYAAGAGRQNEVVALVEQRDSPDLALRAALALAERGQAEGVHLLIESLDSCDGASLCRRTIAALGTLRARQAVPALHRTMANVNARLDVVRALGQLLDPRSVSVLVQALLHDERVPVRAEAAQVLAKYPQARYGHIHSALAKAAQQEREPSVQAAIASALGLGAARLTVPAR